MSPPDEASYAKVPVKPGAPLTASALAPMVILLWLQFFQALTFTWSNGKYYQFGWVVPVLVALCFWRQWKGKATTGSFHSAGRTALSPTIVISSAVVLMLVTLLRILELSDPGWRAPLWAHAMLLFVYSYWFLTEVTGPARARCFFGIGILALTAVPLPSMLEMELVGRLSRWVVEAAASLLTLIGNSTEAHGSMLIVDGRQLQVNQACSGIRSFQGLLMYGVFFGEFWRLTMLGRISLLAVGLVLAIFTNVARVAVLTKFFVARGQEGFDTAHDWVGWLAFLIAAGGLLLAGKFLENSKTAARIGNAPM